MKHLLVLLCLALLVGGCSTVSDAQWQAWADVEKTRLAASVERAHACGGDGTCVAWVNVETSRGATPVPQPQRSAVESIGIELIRSVVPALAGYHGSRMWAGALEGTVNAVAGMDRAYTDNRVTTTATTTTTAGGDQIGGDRTVDNSDRSDNGTTVGGDQIGRDRYSDSCVGTDCRYDSAGPYDQSDNSQTDNSDRSQRDNSSAAP